METALLQALIKLRHAQAPAAAAPAQPVLSVPRLRGDEVERSGLAEVLTAAVLSSDAATVGVTTGLVGAGGFGKTTLARMVAHDPRVRREFRDGVVWVTVGEDADGPDLASKLVSAARLFDGNAPEVTDPLGAGAVLGRALDRRRVLLIVDDVWSTGQVEPFLLGGDSTVRLFTTRQQETPHLGPQQPLRSPHPRRPFSRRAGTRGRTKRPLARLRQRRHDGPHLGPRCRNRPPHPQRARERRASSGGRTRRPLARLGQR